ncbi:GDP-mannose-dependent alpha-(1-2)-phosphatidylinositol mannosyltransferase [Corynebacterium ciconiae DSM 44920]|uniref:glycosyltransferase family 4 protein n=1 Tax=Corynebacterium ciconiae TaxID=227319 RepID=UPI000363F829|nr:glycosyltransferase family 4 protein [Corynebacterium ciconiae]WKD61344.1 GDP-mannose-dependent alpha-(1-2)-phosphatidylinositol mannosyltransferase [Corynebacterium ciconiae DSM 44920]
MRIGIVCPYSFDEPGGVQAHILDLGQALQQRGHYVRAIGPATSAAEVPDWVVRGGRAVPIPYNGSVARIAVGPQVSTSLKNFINDNNFDVLHIHEPNSPSFSMAALRLAHGPIVATYHASSSGSTLLKLGTPVLRPLLEKIRGGIAVSELARRWQVEQLGGDPVLIPNGVDTRHFAAARSRHEEHCTRQVDSEQRGVGDGEVASTSAAGVPNIVFLGRLDEPRKGLDILLRALAQLDRPFSCTVIGAGTQRPMPGVRYVGKVSDAEKADILGRADIYVAPNTGGESFGIVLVEAMAAGCAVLASDLEAFAAVTDAYSDTPAGLLFPNGSAADLAAQLRRLIDSPVLRKGLVEAGAARAASYDWDTVTTQIVHVYEAVADGTSVKLK